jgi:hypothetical protein
MDVKYKKINIQKINYDIKYYFIIVIMITINSKNPAKIMHIVFHLANNQLQTLKIINYFM